MKKLFFSIYLSFYFIICLGQDKEVPILTADSLATGNYKDVLTSFFQLAFDRFTGPDKELKFSSNPYAIMMRADPDLAVDTSYMKYRTLRNLNFSFGAKLNESYKFNGFSAGINYAIINKRDETICREFLYLVMAKNKDYEILNEEIAGVLSMSTTDATLKSRLNKQFHSLYEDGAFNFSMLDPDVKKIIEDIIADKKLTGLQKLISEDGNVNIHDAITKGYENVRQSFRNRPLWTVAISDTAYQDQLLFSNLAIVTQFLKGISNPANNHGVELDLKGTVNFLDDSLRAGNDLKRSLLNVEGGLNYVWRSKKTDLSFFEFKMSASYGYIFNGLYADEKRQLFTLNGGLRIRVFDDIWIPLQFRYEPGTGNVFGFLNVKANFTAMNKLLSGKS
ncbi:MAG: hypothetical protein QM763_21450 [Agriterribacter sp.]